MPSASASAASTRARSPSKRKARKSRVMMVPREGTIAETEAFEIKTRITSLAGLEQILTGKKSYAKWYGAFNRRFRLTKYEALPARSFTEATLWLEEQSARLERRLKRVHKPVWRRGKYAAIQAALRSLRCPKQTVYEQARAELDLAKPFTSPKELTDTELERVAGWAQRRSRAAASAPAAPSRAAPVAIRDKVFVSYSHRDRRLFGEFKTMLAPALRHGKVELWDDQRIEPGKQWRKEIERALASTRVAVLLVSQNFLASDFIARHELPPLLEGARNAGVIVFWVYLSPCLYEQTEIGTYQAAHDVSRPLDQMSKPRRQAVLSQICAKLLRVVHEGSSRTTTA